MNFQVLAVKRVYLRSLSCAYQRLNTLVEKYNIYNRQYFNTIPLTEKERRVKGNLPTFEVILTVLLNESMKKSLVLYSLLKYTRTQTKPLSNH